MICALELERREDPERLWSWPFEIGLRVERQADSGGGQPIYRRLPCFLIATVDKFASLPFEGRMGVGLLRSYLAKGI